MIMKRLSFTIGLLILSSIINAQLPTDGLAGYWPFNGNANDESGNGYNGTINGAILTTDRFGNENSAYYFDGINDNIFLGNSLIIEGANISISCWIKSENGGYAIGSGNRNSYRIGQDDPHSITGGLYLSDATDGHGSNVGPISIDNSIWNHIVMTYNGTDHCLYINGVLVSQVIAEGLVFSNQTVYNHFGVYQYLGSNYSGWFEGNLDDIRFYNKTLNEAEILSLYHENNYATVTDVDGNTYNTVKIGDQVWMAENLKTTHYADGTEIPLIENTTNWNNLFYGGDKGMCYYDNSTANKDTYGALYTWSAAMNGATSSIANPSNVQGACPDGWHLPSDAEWMELTNYLTNNGHYNTEGTALKSINGWYNNGNGTDNYGFTALPSGVRESDGVFTNLNYYNTTYFWGATETTDAFNARTHGLGYNSTSVARTTRLKNYGLSVRCVKDEDATITTLTTAELTNITQNTVTAGGNISDDGGASVTARGVCWSASPNPTISDNKTTDGTGTGSFTSSITGLTANTTYYVRAYATNSAGTAYGNEVSFTTDSLTPTSQFLTTINGPDTLCLGTSEDYTVNVGVHENHYLFRDTAQTTSLHSALDAGYEFDDLTNTFSYDLWVKPTRTITMVGESSVCSGGVSVPLANSGQNWAIVPRALLSPNMSVGLTIGTNGLMIGEHSTNILVSRLSYATTINDWVHVAIVYDTDSVFLYLNGDLVRKREIHCPTNPKCIASGLAGYYYSPEFLGDIDEFRVWDISLTKEQINLVKDKKILNQVEGLRYYASFDNGKFERTVGDIGTSNMIIDPTISPDKNIKSNDGNLLSYNGTNINNLTQFKVADLNYLWSTGETTKDITYTPQDTLNELFVTAYNSFVSKTDSLAIVGKNCSDLNNGLVAYYPFNGNAKDESGNGHDGTVNGASLTTDRFGKTNSAYEFSSTGQNLDFFNSGTWAEESHTISFWFNSAFISGKDQFILTKRSDCMGGDELPWFETAIHRYENTAHIGWAGNGFGSSFSFSFMPDQWNNVVYVINGTNALLYLNGALVGSQVYVPTTNNIMLRAGNHSCPVSNDDYNGKFDDLRLYNRALTEAEVDSLYHENGYKTLTDIDGNTYNTVKIGNQVWMAENLKTTHYADGTEITLAADITSWSNLSDTGKAYCYVNNLEENTSIYGLLYTWATAMNNTASSNTNPSNVQGVCPDGWHLPSDDEWKELEMYLGMSQVDADATGWRGTNEGAKLAGRKDLWDDQELENDAQFGTSGFMALPTGTRLPDGTFGGLSYRTWFWSSTEYGGGFAWDRYLNVDNPAVTRGFASKGYGFPVRCLKDEVMLPLSVDQTISHISCYNSSNGAIDLTISGGVQPYSVLWSNGEITEDLVNLTAGSYSVTITDANGVVKTDSVTITEPNAISLGGSEIQTEGLVAYYPFNSNANDESINANHGIVNEAILTTDRFGDSNSAYHFDGVNDYIKIAGALPITNTFTISFWTYAEDVNGYHNILCDGSSGYGGNDFLINFRGNNLGIRADKNAPLNYEDSSPAELSNLDLINKWVHVVWVMNPTSSKIYLNSNLLLTINESGSNEGYHDDFSFIGARQVWGSPDNFFKGKIDDLRIYEIELDSDQISALFSESTNSGSEPEIIDVTCFGESNGSINFHVSGGTAPYLYDWSNGSSIEDQTNLAAGNYGLTITDANACSFDTTFTITEPDVISAIETITDVNCYGDATGSIDLTVNGGTSPYTYNWSNGSTEQNQANLTAGTYTVDISDANGCIITEEFTITEPASALSVEGIASDANCSDEATGSIDLTVIGGTSPYTYSWSNGSAEQNQTNLTAGTYSVTINDSNGCSYSTDYDIQMESKAILSGTVSYSNGFIDAGDATVFLMDATESSHKEIARMSIQEGGFFEFNDIPSGAYYIKVKIVNHGGDNQKYQGVIPSYYNNTHKWKDAEKIYLSCNDDKFIEMEMFENPSASNGNGKVSGNVILKTTKGLKTDYSFIEDADVILIDTSTDLPVAYASSLTNGDYEIIEIPLGEYALYVDISGVMQDTTYYFNITNDIADYSNLDFVVDLDLLEIYRFNDPTDIELSRNSIDENLPPGTKVSDLKAIDQDKNETHTFMLIPSGDNRDADNESFLVDGSALKTNEMFNYEQKDMYSIYVQVIDERGRSFERALEIIIEDENDLPTDITISNDNIDEDQPLETYVGTFNVVDEDVIWPHSYKLVEGDGVNDAGNNSFIIDGKRLRTNEVFDYDEQQNFNIYVQVIDAGGGSFEKEFVIYINSSTSTGIENMDNESVMVYPNPAQEFINLSSELFYSQDVKIILYSSSGAILKTQDFSPDVVTNNKLEFHFPDISDGYYLIRIVVLTFLN